MDFLFREKGGVVMKRITNWLLAGGFCAGMAGLAAAGCGKAAEEPYVYNCDDVCTSYGACATEVGASIDITQCVTSCEAQADTKPDFQTLLEGCQNCIWDAETCQQELACATTCMGLVPEVTPPPMVPVP
jgi:hypothetical protein